MSSWFGLLLDLPTKKIYLYLWLTVTLAPIFLYLFLRQIKKNKVYDFEILFPALFLIAGVIQIYKYNWLHIAYIIYLIPVTAFFPRTTALALSLAIPVVEIGHFRGSTNTSEEIALNLSVLAAIAITYAVNTASHKMKDKLETQLESLRDSVENNRMTVGSAKDGTDISQYLSSIAKAEDEIEEVLHTIKKSLLADSVNFFVPQDNGLKLRGTTGNARETVPSGEGLIMQCFRGQRVIVSSTISENGYEVGYLRKGKIASFIAIPVIDAPFVLGVLSADTSRYAAFTDIDANMLQLFAKQLRRILQRERVYSQVQRSLSGLTALQKESAQLASSIKIDELSEKLVQGSRRIAPASVIFLRNRGNVFEFAGGNRLEKESFSVKGTLIDMVKKNMEPFYISDIGKDSASLLPFKTKDVSSVLILPLIYEREIQGVLVFLSEKINAFNSHQIELLKVLANQAALSFENARLHEELERKAITDGLTGLFNHRHFQERLSDEIRRYSRSLEPLSLLLIDIDYFKKVNDTYGHPAGDRILQGVAKILKNTLRETDLPARYGGEEFAAILPGTDSAGAKNMAERLRRTIMATPFTVNGRTLNVTVSIGITTIAGAADKKESLIERADQALYRAKKAGRNQSVSGEIGA